MPLRGESPTEESGIFQVSFVHDLPVDASDIAEKTRRDPVLSRVLEYVLTGWPNHVDKDLQMYFSKRNDLSTEQGSLLWGSRVVIPSTNHELILEELASAKPKRLQEATSGGLEWMLLSRVWCRNVLYVSQ